MKLRAQRNKVVAAGKRGQGRPESGAPGAVNAEI
jgi:hypothetical protein